MTVRNKSTIRAATGEGLGREGLLEKRNRTADKLVKFMIMGESCQQKMPRYGQRCDT